MIFTPTDFAIAIRWITALVDPPNAITTVSAFSNALSVMMSRGFKSFSNKARIAFAAFTDSFDFSLLSAGLDEVKGNAMPSASIADAIVLAVYIPPHAPAPGQAF